MKVVLPVLYCPSSSTEGFASKSDSVNSEEKKLPNLYASSSGLICSIATCILSQLNKLLCCRDRVSSFFRASGKRRHTLLHVASFASARSKYLPNEKGGRRGGQQVRIPKPCQPPLNLSMLAWVNQSVTSTHSSCRAHLSPLCPAQKGLLLGGSVLLGCACQLCTAHDEQCSMQAHLVEVDCLEPIYDAGAVLHGKWFPCSPHGFFGSLFAWRYKAGLVAL